MRKEDKLFAGTPSDILLGYNDLAESISNSEISVSIGKKIRQGRNALKLTMEELAELAEISPSYMGLLERGERKPSLGTLNKIAFVLGTTADEILRDTEIIGQDISINRKKLNAYINKLDDRQLQQLVLIVKATFFFE